MPHNFVPAQVAWATADEWRARRVPCAGISLGVNAMPKVLRWQTAGKDDLGEADMNLVHGRPLLAHWRRG